MSHVTKIKFRVGDDLDLLEAACARRGTIELKRGQKTYRWFGEYMGDSKLPAGVDPSMLGRCEHAIVVKGAGRNTYEIGLVRAADGNGYELLWDEWNGGNGLVKAVGEGASLLMRDYAVTLTLATLPLGTAYTEEVLEDGTVAIEYGVSQ